MMVLAVFSFKLPVLDTASGALEGIIMGIWPIMFVIVMALFAYNVTTESGGMETIQICWRRFQPISGLLF